MKKIRLLIFAGYYYPFRGGYVESIHALARRLVAKGHKVTVLTGKISPKSPWEETIDGVRILRVPCWNMLNGTYPVLVPGLRSWRVWQQLKRENHHIVSTQTRFFVSSMWGALFAKLYKKPQIHTERGGGHSLVESTVVKWMGKVIDHTLGTMVIRSARLNIGVSQQSGDFLRHLGAKKVKIIPNGVDIIPSASELKKKKLKEKWGLENAGPLILFVGRLIYAKGLQDSFEAIKSIASTYPSLKLVVVGEGPYRSKLEEESARLGLKKFLIFKGAQNQSEVKELLSIADVFINPSHSEGLPRSVLEAAAAGLPIVATDVGGTDEIVRHGVSGVLVKESDPSTFKEGVSQIVKHRVKARHFGRKAQEHVKEHFQWEKITQAYVDLFSELR